MTESSVTDAPVAKLPLTLLEEVVALREQVTSLQARGTEQLTLARRCAFETAAKVCEDAAVRIMNQNVMGGEDADYNESRANLCSLLAELILEKT